MKVQLAKAAAGHAPPPGLAIAEVVLAHHLLAQAHQLAAHS
jgi:hypothetical protein